VKAKAASAQPWQEERRAPAPEPVSRPAEPVQNVLLITIDTFRADAPGFAGDDKVQTPTLDRLASQGVYFPEAHAQNVVTLPSHTNILTGLYPYQHGVRDNAGFVLRKDVPTAATHFHDAGFATAAVVGAFPLDARFGLSRGFDLYDDHYAEGSEENQFVEIERRGDEVVSHGEAWWKAHRGKRRFLWIHLYDPHAPYEPPEPFASRYADNPYLGEVAAVDHFLKPFLQPFLDGKEEPTLIVLTGDHGEGLGDHGETTHSLFTYEATLRIPLVVWGPGIEPETSHRWARHIDILPTLLDAAGLPIPSNLPGRSLLEPAPKDPAANASYFEALSANMSRGWAPLRGVIEGGYKLIVLPIPELYDLRKDPGETHNIFTTDQRHAHELARLLPAESVWPPAQGKVSGTEASALESLGYLSGSVRHKTHYTAADDPKNLIGIDQKFHKFIDLYQEHELVEATHLIEEIVKAQPDMGIAYNYYAQILLQRGLDRQALQVLQQGHDRGVATVSADRQYGLLLAELGQPERGVEILRPLAAAGDPDNLNALGVALLTAGHAEEAKSAFDEVFQQDPRNPVAHQNLALLALNRQNWATARDEARKALDLNDKLPRCWNYLGVALYNLGKVHEGLDAWDRAVTLQPRNPDLLFNLGLVAAQAGETERARKALERFVSVAPPAHYGPDLAKARSILRKLGAGGGS
jgi:arylsulfatase A-like enzyme/Tfp pilus assembly protein PilF